MPAQPWVSLRQPEPGREYVVLLSELPLKFSGLPKFFATVGRIDQQLKRTSGLIGYSMLARPLRMKFWTLSVWESDASLTWFVRERPHSEVMTALKGKMGPTRFIQWKITASQYPPSWQDALERRT
jgi:heme-degrading monooxygenase HmoA